MDKAHALRLLAYAGVILVAVFAVQQIAQNTTDRAAAIQHQSEQRDAQLAYDNAVRQCLTTLHGRQLANATLIKNSQELQAVVHDFAAQAAIARLANYNATHLTADLAAAKVYGRDARRVAALTFKPYPLPNCAQIPHPTGVKNHE